MQLFTTLPYKLVRFDGTLDRAQPEMAFIVKGTFQFANWRQAVAAEDQIDCAGDGPHMDAIGRSLRHASDFCLRKPHGEVLLTADCHAPDGFPATTVETGLEIGPIVKKLSVTGDRVWTRDAQGQFVMSPPAPFLTMPLRWERAFGGLAVPANPVGRGLDPWPCADGQKRLYLANIEAPQRRVQHASDRPTPAGYGPLSPQWAQRRQREGTRDQHWAHFVAPLPPADYDPRCQQAAPEDQWIQGFWRGDERIELTHMHPQHARYVTQLPGLRIRLFLEVATGEPEPRFGELPLDLDTIHVDLPKELMTLVWRQSFRPASPGAPEIRASYLAQEALADEPAPVEAHHQAFLALRGPAPEAKQAQARRDEQAALAQARQTLAAAKLDPAVLARFDAAPDSQAKFAMMTDLVKSKTAELEAMTAALMKA